MTTQRMFLIDQTSRTVTGWGAEDSYLSHIAGRFENKFQDFCRLGLSPDDVAMDIGANIGVTSIILSHFLKDGKVVAVEPGPRLFELLTNNIAANGIDNVTAHKCAISSRSGRMNFYENSAFGYLVESSDAPASEEAVEARALDDFVDSLGLDRLDFLKIDTEGFEPQVFAGAHRTLARFKPIVFFELNTWTLLAHGQNDPLKFAQSICERFGQVYRVRKDAADLYMEQLDGHPREVAAKMVHDNIAFHSSWDDFIVCEDKDKILAIRDRVNGAFETAVGESSSETSVGKLITRARRKLGRLVAGGAL